MTDISDTLPLIRTKLHRPLIPQNHVHRPRLLEKLNNQPDRPLTLISAPAGYGKSTLARDAIQSVSASGDMTPPLNRIAMVNEM